MITVPYELYLKLKEEHNASGLIQELLMKHYNKHKDPKKIIEEVKQKMKENKIKEKFQKRKDKATKKLKTAILKEMNK